MSRLILTASLAACLGLAACDATTGPAVDRWRPVAVVGVVPRRAGRGVAAARGQ